MISLSISRLSELSRADCDRLFGLLFLLLTGLHLFILATSPLDLVSDEALYWEYSKHLDWCFYSKGPAIAIATWLSTHIFGDTVLGVRIAALFCFSVFSGGLYFFLRSLYSPQLALAGFLFTRLTLMFAVNGFVLTTDPLVLVFWLGSLICAYAAIRRNEPWYWVPAFFLSGVGILAKFTAVLLPPAYACVLLLSKERRCHLRSKGFWLGGVAFLLTLLPILIWNAEHGWVDIGHNFEHTEAQPESFPFEHLPAFIAGQVGLVGPVLLPIMLFALWRGGKRWIRERDDIVGLWVMATLPLLLVCIKVAMGRSCYANWPLPAYVGGLILAVGLLQSTKRPVWFGRALAVNALVLLILQPIWYMTYFYPSSWNLPVAIRRMSGWSALGAAVSSSAETMKAQGKSTELPFVVALDYMTASSLRFSVDPRIPVRLGSFAGRRLTDQDFWQTWEDVKGRDAIVVASIEYLKQGTEPLPWFSSCERLELPGIPPAKRMAKPFVAVFCKDYNGKPPAISEAY